MVSFIFQDYLKVFFAIAGCTTTQPSSSELGVNMPGAAAFRGIAGDVEKITFLVAAGTCVGGLGRGEGVTAFATAPIGKIAIGADIPYELA